MPILIIILVIALIFATWQYFSFAILGVAIAVFLYKLFWYLVEHIYFNSSDFRSLKYKLQKNIQDCNELNSYIENLKASFLNIGRTDYGKAIYQDQSQWNYTRSALETLAYCNRTYDCSAAVCKRAQEQPFKYFCKYFNVPVDEETLINFEQVFNNFSSVEQGKKLLLEERDKLMEGIKNFVPFLIYRYKKQKLLDHLGFSTVKIKDVYFPRYTFRYMSPAGKSSLTCRIIFNIENLERFIKYLANIIKFRNSIAGQRALMTTALRNKIKQRDNYTCQCCGISIHQEPHILLEIDHIKPLSKGGVTTENNLQTLCWRCNRSKSNKFQEEITECDREESYFSSIAPSNVDATYKQEINDASEQVLIGNPKPIDIDAPKTITNIKGENISPSHWANGSQIEIQPRKRIGMMIGTVFFGFYAFIFGVGCIADVAGTIYYRRSVPKMLPMLAFAISFSILSYMFCKLAKSPKGDTHIGNIKKSKFVLRCIGASILSFVILLTVLVGIVA